MSGTCCLPPGMCPLCGGWSENGSLRDGVVAYCGCAIATWPLPVLPLGGDSVAGFQAVGVCIGGCDECRVPVAWRPCPQWWTVRCAVCGPDLALAMRSRELAWAWMDRHLLLTGHIQTRVDEHQGHVVSVWPALPRATTNDS